MTFSKPLRPCHRLVDRTLYLLQIHIENGDIIRNKGDDKDDADDNENGNDNERHLRLGETKSTAEPPAESANT